MSESQAVVEAKLLAEAKQAWLHDHGFDRTVVQLGGGGFLALFGGVSEAAVCLTCYALVPIADLVTFNTTIEAHEHWHQAEAAS